MYTFDGQIVKEQIVKWIREWFHKNGDGCNAIVGISGGKDSSIVAGLCVEALGKDRVIGVLMPSGDQDDINYAYDLCTHLGIKSYKINIFNLIEDTYENMVYENIPISIQTKINLPARIRMSILYAVSQSCNGRVANTCNLSEDWVGYATRYGDGAGDFSPLSNLTVSEVKEIGRKLKLPNQLIEKVPIDGLCGRTDEENLGFSYDVLDRYIREGICEDLNLKNTIDEMHEKNLFKSKLMDKFEFNI